MKSIRLLDGAVAVLLFVLFSIPVFAQQTTEQQKELAEYIRDKYTKREVMIPMRDGVRLFTSIYEPKSKSQKYPVMLSRTPYTVAPYSKDKDGNDQFKAALGPNELFAREGYIFVYQDVRGRWASEGQFEDVRPDIANNSPKEIDESTDTYDTVEWLLKNTQNNNGRVGMWGISYPGFYTSAGIIDSHPAIKAASPQAPVSDWFQGDDMHHNGALFLAQNYAFFKNFGQPRPVPTNNNAYLRKWNGRNTQDGYDYGKLSPTPTAAVLTWMAFTVYRLPARGGWRWTQFAVTGFGGVVWIGVLLFLIPVEYLLGTIFLVIILFTLGSLLKFTCTFNCGGRVFHGDIWLFNSAVIYTCSSLIVAAIKLLA